MIEITASEIERSFDLYADMLMRIAFHHLQNREDAEDIVQEAFLRLQKQKHMKSEEHIKHWLIRVTSNLSINELRHARRRREVPLDERLQQREESITNVRELLKRLDPKYRDALYLHYYEGYKIEEIAEIFGITRSTAATWLKRGRDKLKLVIEEEAYEY